MDYYIFWSAIMGAFWLLLWHYGRRIVVALRDIHKALKL